MKTYYDNWEIIFMKHITTSQKMYNLFKGTAAWNGFFAYSKPFCVESKDVKYFSCRTINNYSKISKFCISWRSLHVRIDSFRVFWDDFVYRKQPKIRRILHIRLNTFHVFSENAERMKNMRKGILFFISVSKPKCENFVKNQIWVIYFDI